MTEALKLKIVNLQKVKLARGDLLVLKVPRHYVGYFPEIERKFNALPLPKGVIRVVMMEEFELTAAKPTARR